MIRRVLDSVKLIGLLNHISIAIAAAKFLETAPAARAGGPREVARHGRLLFLSGRNLVCFLYPSVAGRRGPNLGQCRGKRQHSQEYTGGYSVRSSGLREGA
jgi:hypothetical protein